ncbi:hypothetical protein LguiB_002085 [Lonicera macranthoides]
MHRNYIPIVLYFPNNACDSAQKIAEKSRQLKHSLSEALVQYYPFAGRLTCRAYIDCNDEGVEFQEAQIKFGLSEILKKHEDAADLDFVFPRGLVWGRFANESSVMVVRFNYFDCGGIAVAVCLSHKIADGCTFASFLHYWAAVTRQSGSFSPSMLVLPVNMRPNMVPQLPKTSAGNLFWQLYLPTTTESKLSLNSITDRIKKGKMKIKGMEVLDGKEFMSPICKAGENNYKIYFCSSICNLDLYKVDFGWGKPVKVALGDTPFNNSFIFMETPSGDGIEALVSLDEQEMLKFQVDEEIMALA